MVKHHQQTERYLVFTFWAAIVFIFKLYNSGTSLSKLPYLPQFLQKALAEYCTEHTMRKSNVASSRLTFMNGFIQNRHRVPKDSYHGGTNNRKDTQTHGYDRSIYFFRTSIRSFIYSNIREGVRYVKTQLSCI